MEFQANANSEELNIQELLGTYLNLQFARTDLTADSVHLDEDSLAAFVEGSLGHRETQPIVSHLVECSFCRNVTTELVKLDFTFGAEEAQPTVSEESPLKISQVLSNVLSRIFGSNDGAVFAHQEKEEEEETGDSEKKE